jgi:hypothetical protein
MIAWDVTDQKQAEEALSEAKEARTRPLPSHNSGQHEP